MGRITSWIFWRFDCAFENRGVEPVYLLRIVKRYILVGSTRGVNCGRYISAAKLLTKLINYPRDTRLTDAHLRVLAPCA